MRPFMYNQASASSRSIYLRMDYSHHIEVRSTHGGILLWGQPCNNAAAESCRLSRPVKIATRSSSHYWHCAESLAHRKRATVEVPHDEHASSNGEPCNDSTAELSVAGPAVCAMQPPAARYASAESKRTEYPVKLEVRYCQHIRLQTATAKAT